MAAAGAALVGAVTLAQATTTVQSGSRVIAVRAATITDSLLTTASGWQDVPGATVTVPGPNSGTAFLVIHFTSDAGCQLNTPPPSNVSNQYCMMQVLVDGVPAQPNTITELVATAPSYYIADHNLSLQRVSGAIGSGTHEVRVQYQVLRQSAGFFELQGSSLVVEESR